jgi:hypothetical protein
MFIESEEIVKFSNSGFVVRKSILDIYKCPFSKNAKKIWKIPEKKRVVIEMLSFLFFLVKMLLS